MLVAPGSRCGRSTQPSMRITSTHARLAHNKTMNTVSPSLTKDSQLCASSRGETKAASARLLADLQNGQKRLLRDLNLPDLLHAFLAGFLFLEQLALARDVAAVTLGEHVLAHRFDAGARDDVGADRRLHGDVEHLPWNELLHLVDQFPASRIGIVAVDDERQRIHGIAVDQDVELDQRRRLKMAEL